MPHGSNASTALLSALLVVKRFHMGSYWMATAACRRPSTRFAFEMFHCSRRSNETNKRGADYQYLLRLFDQEHPLCCDHTRCTGGQSCPMLPFRLATDKGCIRPCEHVGASLVMSEQGYNLGTHNLQLLLGARPHVQLVLHSRRNLVKWACSMLSDRYKRQHKKEVTGASHAFNPRKLGNMAVNLHHLRVMNVGMLERMAPLTRSGRFVTFDYEDLQADLDGTFAALFELATGAPVPASIGAASARAQRRSLHSVSKVHGEALRNLITNFDEVQTYLSETSPCMADMLMAEAPLARMPRSCVGLRKERCFNHGHLLGRRSDANQSSLTGHEQPDSNARLLISVHYSMRGILGVGTLVGTPWCPAPDWRPDPKLAVAVMDYE